jgi:XTP/dITP diphosphohydrolase
VLKILLATNNPGKLAEIHALLEDLPIALVTPRQLGIALEVVEDGESYAANAALKAVAFARLADMLTLADDSGLEVAALDGKPGLHSARFDPRPGARDADRRKLLLSKLVRVPRPWQACFQCTIALAAPGEETHFFSGSCCGEIIPQERGDNGFGYDPIFLFPDIGRTMAELSMAEKNRLSHRAHAVIAARPYLEALAKR